MLINWEGVYKFNICGSKTFAKLKHFSIVWWFPTCSVCLKGDKIVTCHFHSFLFIQDQEAEEFFFSPAEEHNLCRHYEYIMKEFCNCFQPPMPKYVLVSWESFLILGFLRLYIIERFHKSTELPVETECFLVKMISL